MMPLTAVILVVLVGQIERTSDRDRMVQATSACTRDRKIPCAGGSSVYVPTFSFSPPDGTGMTAPCAGTLPTGTKGEPLTFARASTGWCTLGNETTVLPGDLIELGVDVPRVMPGGDGTGGVGLAVRAQAKTNKLLRSQKFENAAWAKFSFGGPTDPVITADAAISPDNTMNADRIQVPALTTGSQYSIIEASGMVVDDPNSSAIFVAGNAQSGTLHFYTNGSTAADCIACPYVPWPVYTRCKIEGVHGGDVFVIGNDTLDCGGSSKAAVDAFLWQADDQAGPTIGPPITTDGTAATMAAETASFAALSVAAARPTGSLAVTTIGPMANSNEAYVLLFNPMSEPLLYTRYVNQDAVFGMEVYGSVSLSRTAVGPNRLVGWWNATNTAVIANGVQALSAPGTYAGRTMTSLTLGAGVFGGVIKDVCWDSLETYCR